MQKTSQHKALAEEWLNSVVADDKRLVMDVLHSYGGKASLFKIGESFSRINKSCLPHLFDVLSMCCVAGYCSFSVEDRQCFYAVTKRSRT